MPPVPKGNETERDNDKKNSFLVHMPAEQERGVSTQGDSSNEGFPSRLEEELDQRYDLEKECENKTGSWTDFRQYGERRVSNQATGDTLQRALVDSPSDSWGNYTMLEMRSCVTKTGHTMDKDSIRKRIESPDVRRPVSMAKTTGEGEESAQQLGDLTHGSKWTEGGSENRSNAET